MKFKNYRDENAVVEAYNNLTDNYAIISGDIKKLQMDLKEFSLYRVQAPTFKSKSITENIESYVVINLPSSKFSNKEFKQKLIETATEHNQGNIRLFENDKNYLISTSLDAHAYPGYGKIGVQVELSFDLFNKSKQLNELVPFSEDIENLNIVFPTEDSFFSVKEKSLD